MHCWNGKRALVVKWWLMARMRLECWLEGRTWDVPDSRFWRRWRSETTLESPWETGNDSSMLGNVMAMAMLCGVLELKVASLEAFRLVV